MDHFGKRSDLSARIVKYPEVMVSKTNSDRTLGETTTETFECIPGLLGTRQIPSDDERVRLMPYDPLLDLQECLFLRSSQKMEVGGK